MKKIIIIGLILALCLFSVPVAAAIGYVSSTNNQTNTISLTIPGVYAETNDLLLAQITFNGGDEVDITPPDGTWSTVRRTDNNDDIGQIIYYKIVTVTGTSSYTWTLDFNGHGERAVGGIMRFTGVNMGSPIFGSSGGSGNSDDLTAPGINGVPAGSMLIACFGFDRQEGDFNVPANMTWNYRYYHNSSSGPSGAAARENWTSGGNTGSRTSSNGAAVPDDNWVAQLVAIRDGGILGNISGYKVYPNSTGIGGWQITLNNSTNSVFRTCTTASNGFYIFQNLPLYVYQLNETLPSGWTQDPSTPNRTVQINVTTPSLTNQNFTNYRTPPRGNISGYKLYPNGTPIGGWQITLSNQSNSIFLTCTTASNGSFFFGNLSLYFYQLNETLPGGWTQWPNTPNRTIQLNATNLTFTNQTFINKICPPPPPPPPEGNLTINKTVYPENINLSGTSCFVQNTTVTISITGYGCGNPACGANSSVPLDIIFAIDSSGSMCGSPSPGNDPTNLRLKGATDFLNQMNASKDQVGIVNWDDQVDEPTYPPSPYPPGLGNNFVLANNTIWMNSCGGTTCGECAIIRSLQMMENNPRCPNVNSSKAIIFLTDGVFNVGGNTNASFNDEISWANALNTKIYTIGLGTGVNPGLLTYIAQGTGGSYYFAANNTSIAGIYNQIYTEIISITSPSYVNVTEVLEPYIIVDQGSFNYTPNSSHIGNNTYIWTNIAQHVGNKNQRLNLVETVNITFNISSSQAGSGLQVNNGSAKVTYINSRGIPVEVTIPYANVTINVSSCPGKLCISGYKIDNCTGQGLSGWNITVSNQTAQVAKVQTNATGYYQVCNLTPANYTVCEELQPGWTNLSQLCQPANITGANLTNQNFTNQKQLCISGTKFDDCTGEGLPNWTITLTNGTYTVATTTNATGQYQFCGLMPGNYSVTETVKDGWVPVTPTQRSVTLGCDNRTGQDFTNMPYGNISGMKFNDLDGNGIKNINDEPLPNWTINLYYAGNGTFITSAVTNGTGEYVFKDLPCGIYRVNETPKPDWTQTAPAGGNYIVEINGTSHNVTGRDFGNQQQIIRCACPTRAYYTYAQVGALANHTIQFTDKSTGYPVEWNWSFGDGTYSNLKNPLHQYASPGYYKITEYVKVCGCTGQVYWTSYTRTSVRVR